MDEQIDMAKYIQDIYTLQERSPKVRCNTLANINTHSALV